ncbi:PEP-CTERM-box response regulator transcription factor, partial [Desulfomarina sp.]
MKPKLLIIEDELSVAKQLRWGLDKEYDITIATTVKQAKPLLASGVFRIATLDLGLPPYPDSPRQGFSLLEEIPALAPHCRIIVITGNAEKENAIRAVAMGAADFCAKPIDLKVLKIILSRTLKIHQLEEENRQQQCRNYEKGKFCGMIGSSTVMQEIFRQFIHAGKTDYPVLLSGNTGTGKEIAARAIHSLSSRSDKPFITINCGAIPENLLESELFGHEKGSFTGAAKRKTGKFEQADHGTIFLDEIGELPHTLQVKLLRVLQEGTIDRVGGNETIKLDIRIIAATNRNLAEETENNRFREDLFYRLNVVPINLPDLKERQEDILLLAQDCLNRESEKLQRKASFAPAALAARATHPWPGNVRELQNRIKRALGSTQGKIISLTDMGFQQSDVKEENQKLSTLKQARESAEYSVVCRALALSNNNISRAAKLLEISRPTLHDLIKK